MTETDAPLHGLANDQQVLDRIANKLASRFSGISGAAETVERYVFKSCTAMARTSKVRNFLVARTERFAADRLTGKARPSQSPQQPDGCWNLPTASCAVV